VLGNANAQPIIDQMMRLQKNLGSGKITSEQFESSFNGLITQLSKIGGLNMSNSSLKKMFKDLIKDSEDSAKAVKEVEVSVDDLQKNISGNFENIEKYGKFLDEIKEKGTLSATSKKEILTKEPDLIPFLKDPSMNQLKAELNKRIEKHKKDSVDDYATIGVKQEAESINELINKYKDLSSQTDLSDKEKKDLADTAEQLKGKVDGLSVSQDNNGKTMIKGIEIAEDRIKTLDLEGKYIQNVERYGQKEAEERIYAELSKTDKVIEQVEARKKAYQDEIDDLEKKMENPVYSFFMGWYAKGQIKTNKEKIAGEDKTLEDLKAKNKAQSKEQAQKIIEGANKKIAESEKNVSDISDNLTNSTNKNTQAIKDHTLAIKVAK
jgi:chromosome segregation ATPase